MWLSILVGLISGNHTRATHAIFNYGPMDTNTLVIPSGFSLIANPLDHVKPVLAEIRIGDIILEEREFFFDDNFVQKVLPVVPERTILFKFKGGMANLPVSKRTAQVGANLVSLRNTQGSYVANQYRSGRWSQPEQTFAPGEGGFIFNPTRRPFALTFTGRRQFVGDISLPGGFSLISNPNTSQSSFFEYPEPDCLTGVYFNPQEGDHVFTFDRLAGGFVKHTFHSWQWDVMPTTTVGEAFFVQTQEPRTLPFTLGRCIDGIRLITNNVSLVTNTILVPSPPTPSGP